FHSLKRNLIMRASASMPRGAQTSKFKVGGGYGPQRANGFKHLGRRYGGQTPGTAPGLTTVLPGVNAGAARGQILVLHGGRRQPFLQAGIFAEDREGGNAQRRRQMQHAGIR